MTVPMGGMQIHSTGVPLDVGFANPMTTLGDMIFGGVAGLPTRLPVGGTGKVLTVIAGVPAWPADAAAGVDAVAVSQTIVAPLSRGAGAAAQLLLAVGVPHASDGVLQTATPTVALSGDGSVTLGLAAATLSTTAPYTTDTNVGLRVSSKVQVYRAAGIPGHRLFRVNTSFAAPSAIANGDGLGTFDWGGYDGAALAVSANVAATATEAWGGAAHGTKILFQVTPVTTVALTAAWTMQMPTTVISEFLSNAVTARIIGGATNGLAIRNSANTRDNLLVADNGSVMTLTDGVSFAQIVPGGISGEITAGARYSSTAGTWLNNNGAAGIIGIAYNDTVAAQYRSAVEVATAAGFSVLKLMRSGGQVTINDGSAGTPSALYVKGNAYGAGVASIRVDGLTNGAAAAAGTLLNAPAAGNPTFWMPINVAGVVKFVPCW